jgi:hypothetical protein
MDMHDCAPTGAPTRPVVEIADIVGAHGKAFRAKAPEPRNQGHGKVLQ